MHYNEYKAETLDEAITAASVDLGVTSDELYYEVADKGSSGILGFGKKDVIIYACRLSEKEEIDKKASEVTEEDIPSQENTPAEDNNSKDEAAEIDIDLIKSITTKFIKDVFATMELDVEVDIQFIRDEKHNVLSIDLSGEHMAIIIGKRGQTLDAFQYLISLIVNKNSESYIRVKLDTEDYRRRREETLENLARNIASKVKRTGKPFKLEPMSPYERRAIHSALQKDNSVTTYSVGDEPNRHVVITAKK